MTGSNEMAAGDQGGSRAYRIGVGVAAITSLLSVWTTVVRDDGNGIGFFMLIMTALVGGAACEFRSAGMTRTMIGVAIMQALLGIAIASAPITERVAGASLRILLFSGAFATLWLISAAAFRAAANAHPVRD